MPRSNRFALVLATLLALVVAGSVTANRAPRADSQPATLADEEDEAEAPPTAEELAHASERLGDAGITVDDATFTDLASRYGVGGAVRLYAWAADPDVELGIDELAQKRDDGMGWGQIAKEIGVHPGLGSIMGNGGGNGGGHGRDTAPGQQKDRASDE